MKLLPARMPLRFAALLLVLVARSTYGQSDVWPQWRGPNGNNHAAQDARLPVGWDLRTGEGIVWKAKLPGRGHSTPVFTPDAIFLTTSDGAAGTQSVLKLNADTGKLLDEWVLHRGTLPARIHPHNSHASPSMAFDGQDLYASFYTNDSIVLTRLTTDGKTVWQQRVCEFAPSAFKFGYGASPIIENDLVIVAGEYDGEESGVYALDRNSGRRVWKIPRPANLNFSTAIVGEVAGARQLLLGGADEFCSYNPETGRQNWRVDTTTEALCGTVVWDDRHVIVSGGNPASGTWCVAADGREKLIWENRVMCYEQSLLAIKNYVFAIADSGVAYCWRIQDGKEMWRKRLCGSGVSASPLLVENRLVIASERGELFVIAASPDRFQMVFESKVGDSIFASPVAIGNRLYLRTAVNEPTGRQEYLVAIGESRK